MTPTTRRKLAEPLVAASRPELVAGRTEADPAFAAEVLEGLDEDRKRIPSTWLYDHRGSELFEEITRLPEYYPTRTETRLLAGLAGQLEGAMGPVRSLVEIGSGSSRKTRLLLAALRGLERYVPVDISEAFLRDAVAGLALEFPAVAMQPLVADFSDAFEIPPLSGTDRRPDAATVRGQGVLGFFPGSTIGNFMPCEAVELLARLGLALGREARLLIGVDTTQDPRLLYPAYDDAAGVTAEFNLNLLDRINRELDGDFDRRAFHHQARYDASLGRMEMHLVSRRAQRVHVLGRTFSFEEGESIHTENMYKHAPEAFLRLAQAAHWQCERVWRDDGPTGFAVYLLRRPAG